MLEIDDLEKFSKEFADIFRQQIAARDDRIAELERRLNALEAANTLRSSLDQLSARMDRVEQKSVVRLASKGAA